MNCNQWGAKLRTQMLVTIELKHIQISPEQHKQQTPNDHNKTI
jgi:hypothetical protein